MDQIKNQVFEVCLAYINERIANAQTALQQAREASNDDTKSSAGDKYETSREMAQQDIDRNKRQLIEAEQQRTALLQLSTITQSTVARNGSLIYTNNGNFYLSISAGQLKSESFTFFAVSAVSPIGKSLLGKQKGEQFEFNGKKYIVQQIS